MPDIDKKSVTIHSWLKYYGAPTAEKLHITVREVATQRVAGENYCEIPADASKFEHTGQITISLPYCHLWSPEDPFLYEVEVKGTADVFTTRFGMRSFRLDPATGRAILNGKPYPMRGSNITIYRFFEDRDRGNLPWTEEWVRKLHKKVKDMHWNSLRYCIGFPPELWYRIADEEGILIQDEFPVWYGKTRPTRCGRTHQGIHRVDAGALEPSLRGNLGLLQRNLLARNRQSSPPRAQLGFFQTSLGQWMGRARSSRRFG